MNIFLWVLQVFLALHTAVGGIWKFSNSEQMIPSLSVIPHNVWLLLGVLEIVCSVGLVLPAFSKRFVKLAPWAAVLIAIEMLVFSGLHLASGATDYAPMIYWLVVAALSGFIAYRRK